MNSCRSLLNRLSGVLALGVLIVASAGCTPSTISPQASRDEKPSPTSVPLRVLVVDDPAWAAALEEQWKARASGEELVIRQVTTAELLEQKRLGCEVIIYPPRLMGELIVRQWLQPVPENMILGQSSAESAEDVVRLPVDDWFGVVRHGTATWGRRLYGVPLGSSTFVLLYRPDIFRKLSLTVPETWSDYEDVAKKLSDRNFLGDLIPAEQEWTGTLEPLAAENVGDLLLARAASAVRVDNQVFTLFDSDSMTPRISQPPYVQAAEAMQRIAYLNPSLPRFNAAQVREKFFAGQCGMALTWPTTDDSDSKIDVGFAELPGTRQIWSFQENAWQKTPESRVVRGTLAGASGRVASVSREARQAKAAFRILHWLTKDDTLKSLGPVGDRATLFARTQRIAPEIWLPESTSSSTAEEYVSIVEESLTNNDWMSVPRIAGEPELRTALAAALENMLAEKSTPEEALQQASQAWETISKKGSVLENRRHYLRSCGEDS